MYNEIFKKIAEEGAKLLELPTGLLQEARESYQQIGDWRCRKLSQFYR